jgi:hypothetical protein
MRDSGSRTFLAAILAALLCAGTAPLHAQAGGGAGGGTAGGGSAGGGSAGGGTAGDGGSTA